MVQRRNQPSIETFIWWHLKTYNDVLICSILRPDLLLIPLGLCYPFKNRAATLTPGINVNERVHANSSTPLYPLPHPWRQPSCNLRVDRVVFSRLRFRSGRLVNKIAR